MDDPTISIKVRARRLGVEPQWIMLNPAAVAYLRGRPDRTTEIVLVTGEFLWSDECEEAVAAILWPPPDHDF